MKILVTGGLGFVGSNFVKYFLGKYKEDKIVVIDKCTYAANITLLKDFKIFKNFSFYKEDICDLEAMDKIFKKEKFDIVLNLAAETSIDRSFINPALFYETNVKGVINLATLAIKYNVKKFHQVSTDEVYGELDLKENRSFKETDPFNPTNPYALSKAHAEDFLKMFSSIYDLNYTVSRPTNSYGPYQAYDKLIPVIISRGKYEQEVPVYGDGNHVRDWIYVYDLCRAIDLIIKDGKKGEVYNVSVHEEHSNISLVRLILKKLRVSSKLINYVPGRKYDDARYSLDTSKIENKLKFRFQYDFEYALGLTIDYYLGKL